MERISHYRLVSRLGKGAMGEVWRAVDERLGRPVALKLLPVARASEQNMQSRLLREAQAASALNHPGIVTVHDVGSWHGQIFMVMELVDGEPLSELARRGVAPEEALRLVAEAAEALAVAHERDILHRDVKGDNLMRTRDGRLKVLDFGLAKLRAQPDGDDAAGATSSAGGGSGLHGLSDLAAVAETLDSTSQSGSPSQSGAPTSSDGPPANPEALRALHGAGDGAANAFPALASPSSSESLTMAGALVGTPVYMAPEATIAQADGGRGDRSRRCGRSASSCTSCSPGSGRSSAGRFPRCSRRFARSRSCRRRKRRRRARFRWRSTRSCSRRCRAIARRASPTCARSLRR